MHTNDYEMLNRTNFARSLALRADEMESEVVSTDHFGCNLEHTRANIFKGLSAQMLRNRKFAGKPNICCSVPAEWYPIGERTVYKMSLQAYTRHTDGYHMKRAH